MTHLEQLTAWLNNAHAMELSLAKVLENHARDAQEHPRLRDRLEEHVIETRAHAERVQDCLALLDESPSAVKATMGNLMGMVQGASTGMFRDELVKNMLADYASEHFEIACYRALIAAAEEADQRQVAEICGEILEEEEAMAAWIESQIDEVTRAVLQQQAHA